MEGTLSFFFVSSLSFPISNDPQHRNIIRTPYFYASDSRVWASSTLYKKIHKLHSGISPNTTEKNPVSGFPTSRKRIHKLKTEVSPHRAVSAVRLLRIEQGGAFADLLSDKGRNSMKREMDYVERTLGFRTRDLEDRDVRLMD